MTTQHIANTLIETAFEFMAKKAGVSIDEIKTYIATSETGANYFADLIKSGIESL